MNFRFVLRIVSYILLIEAALMVPSVCIAAGMNEWNALYGFGMTFVVLFIIVLFLLLVTKGYEFGHFYSREGLVTTGLTWIIISAVGCLPFVFSKEIPNFVDAMFEMVSGFTTTGSSILTNVEAMSYSLLFWRSFSHWIGGMGILVFLLAIVSLGGKNGGFTMHIMRAESPGPTSGKIVPRMKETAKITYIIYAVLTIIDILLLIFVGKMPIFDALCIAFGTAGTGGFGVKADSMASYSTAAIIITTIFMLLFSVNFSIYFLMITGKVKDALKDEEFRCFWCVVFVAILCLFVSALSFYKDCGSCLRDAAFTVSTVISTTGYATTDYNKWPAIAHTILLFCMFVGACAGSTGGGFKQVRLVIMWKTLRRNIHKFLHPSEVRVIEYNDRPMSEGIVNNISSYVIAYLLIVMASTIVVSLDGFDFETNFSAVMATFNNIGPGLSIVGPAGNFASFSIFSKIVLIMDMLAGRLEIMPILILFSKTTWTRAR